MAAAGWRVIVARFPDPNRREHLANITFERARMVTDGDRDHADAILRRHTDRLPFLAPTGWTEFEDGLRSTFDSSDAPLDVLGDDSRPTLARASEMTVSLRRYDADYHAADRAHRRRRRCPRSSPADRGRSAAVYRAAASPIRPRRRDAAR